MLGPSYNTIHVGKRVFDLMEKACMPKEVNGNTIRIGSVNFVKHNLLADNQMCTDDPQLAPLLKDMQTRFDANAANQVQGVTPPIK